MKVTDFNTLTFDCYGTLIDWERGILAELRPWVDRAGKALDDNALLESFGTVEAAVEAELPFRLYPQVLEEVHRRLAAQWGIKATADEAVAFGASVGRWPAFADSATSLQYLKRYYKLVIISNVDRASFARSNEKLQVEFDRIVTAQDVGSYKPSPRNFEYLLDRLASQGIREERILHVAQSLFHDHAVANSFGLASCWINRHHGRATGGATKLPGAMPRLDFQFNSMGELAEAHRKALAG